MRTVDRNRRVSESVRIKSSVTIVTSAPIVLPNNCRQRALEQKSKMETRVRKNTVKLVCSSGSKTPAHLEVLKFALQHLKVPPADLHSVYRDENENRFYLKFIDEAKFSNFIQSLEETYTFPYEDGSTTRVHLEMASRIFRYVRIFSLPPEIDDKDIAHVLGQYGTIRQHVKERFAAAHGVNIYTGVRGIHMEVAKEIPPQVYIGHFRARIYYDGMKNKCFLCKGEGHVKADCPRAVPKDGGNSSNNSGSSGSSYANVTALGEAAKSELPSGNVDRPEQVISETETAHAASSSKPATDPTTTEATPQNTSAVGERNEILEPTVNEDDCEGHDMDTPAPTVADQESNEEMEIDERKAALKRAMISSSEDDTQQSKEVPFVTVQQRKGKPDPKKGKVSEPLPTAALEKRSVSKSQLTIAPRVVPHPPKRTK